MNNQLITSLVALVLVAGCPNQQEPESPRTDEDAARLKKLMQEQLEVVDKIHYAVAFGELAKARESADWLAKNAMVTDVPQSWAGTVSAVQVNAEKVAGAKKLGDIGEGMGAVLEACGDCHQTLGLALKPASGSLRTSGAVNKQMLQHTFAMTQLEHGLLLPSESLWDQGAAMIEAGSFELATDPPTALDAKESDAIAAELKQLGAEASAATTLNAKGRLYGNMMSRCNACHERSRLDRVDRVDRIKSGGKP